MKKAFLLLLLTAVLTLTLAGCTESSYSSNSDFTIMVSGTSGLQFSGAYMVTTAGGDSTSKSVDGTVPAQYSVTGNIVSATFQNQGDSGILRVEILKDGKVINSSDTSAAYGVVSVASQ